RGVDAALAVDFVAHVGCSTCCAGADGAGAGKGYHVRAFARHVRFPVRSCPGLVRCRREVKRCARGINRLCDRQGCLEPRSFPRSEYSTDSAADSVCSLSRLRGRGGEGVRAHGPIFLHAPSLSLQPKSDISDFGQLIGGRTRVNPSSAVNGGGEYTECAARV